MDGQTTLVISCVLAATAWALLASVDRLGQVARGSGCFPREHGPGRRRLVAPGGSPCCCPCPRTGRREPVPPRARAAKWRTGGAPRGRHGARPAREHARVGDRRTGRGACHGQRRSGRGRRASRSTCASPGLAADAAARASERGCSLLRGQASRTLPGHRPPPCAGAHARRVAPRPCRCSRDASSLGLARGAPRRAVRARRRTAFRPSTRDAHGVGDRRGLGGSRSSLRSSRTPLGGSARPPARRWSPWAGRSRR